jgi:hypothetical protein
MSSSRLSRRSLLGSLGAGSALLPLLDARKSFGQVTPPRRLVAMMWPNGVLTKAYWPTGDETNFTLGETLSPLEPFKRDLIVLSGVGIKNPDDSTKAGVQNVGDSHNHMWALLTGSLAVAGLGRPDIKNSTLPGVANSLSIDQHVANGLQKRSPTRIKSLHLGALHHYNPDMHPWSNGNSSISFNGPAIAGKPQHNQHEYSPYVTFDRLFSQPTAAPTLDPRALDRLRGEQKSIFDFLGREYIALGKNLGTSDRRKVELHQQQIRQLEMELDASAARPPVGCAPAVLPDMDKKGVTPTWFTKPENTDRIVRAQMDLALAAMRCDLTRVATFMLVDGANDVTSVPSLGFAPDGSNPTADSGNHHGIAHGAGDGFDSTPAQRKRAVDKWWHQQLAYFLGQLKATPEGNGTMLDNTLVVFFNCMSNGASHGRSGGVPFLLAGNCQGGFRTGRYVKFDTPNPPHNGVLAAIANGVLEGIEPPVTSFGDARYGGELRQIRGKG